MSWGLNLYDTVDHYMNNYLLVLVGVFQCLGCGWYFDFEKTLTKGPAVMRATYISIIGFWVPLIAVSFATVFTDTAQYGVAGFVGLQLLIVFPISYLVSGLSLHQWYCKVLFCGVRRLGYSISMLGRDDMQSMGWWEKYFVFYWGVSVQYVSPALLWFMLVMNLKTDIDSGGYGDYSLALTIFGFLVPAVGLFIILISMCVMVYEFPVHEKLFEDSVMVRNDDEEDGLLVTEGSEAPMMMQ